LSSTQYLLKVGEEKGLIKIRESRIAYPYAGKEYDFTNPEEKIRAKTYLSLILNYKYPADRIKLEVQPPRRVPKLPADIVVYEDDELERAYIVVETKATAQEVEVAKREGLGNANLFLASFLFIVCGEEVEIAYDLRARPSLESLDNYKISAIPSFYGKIPQYRFKKGGGAFLELNKADLNLLVNRFQKCHDAIWEGGKRDPAEAFDEMSKLMFAKFYDEMFTRVGEYYKFQIGSHETPFIVASRVKELYKEVQQKEPNVFREPINVPDHVIFKVVEALQDISLKETDLDAKGRAYESFLDKVFRGEAGQFFTPREIVDFMVRMADPNPKDFIIDPACGSGGFLLYSMKLVNEKVEKDYKGDDRTIHRLQYDFSHNNIFGIEINDRIARVAIMDMVIHEDGHTNIECNDALLGYDYFDPRRDIKPNKYTKVLTNPPFGAVEERKPVLKLYELGKGRSKVKKEILFIERCLDLLAPEGILGIVISDGILANPTLQYVRDFILKKAKILAVISLPQETFIPFGSFQKASVLFLQKKRTENEQQPETIFMAMAEYIGYDSTGKKITQNDLPTILTNFQKFLKGELKKPEVKILRLSDVLKGFPVEAEEKGFPISFNELINSGRWDVEHVRPKIKDLLYTLEAAGCPTLEETQAIRIYRQRAPRREGILKFIEKIDGKMGEIIWKEGTKRELPKGAIFSFKSNTLVISRINAKIGCIAIVSPSLDGILGTGEYYGLEITDPNKILLQYLHVILRSEIVKQQIIARTSGLYSRLNERELLKLRIPLPSIDIQKMVVEAKQKAEELRAEALKIEQDALTMMVENVQEKIKLKSF
jgi:type I restriction enzyme M protein